MLAPTLTWLRHGRRWAAFVWILGLGTFAAGNSIAQTQCQSEDRFRQWASACQNERVGCSPLSPDVALSKDPDIYRTYGLEMTIYYSRHTCSAALDLVLAVMEHLPLGDPPHCRDVYSQIAENILAIIESRIVSECQLQPPRCEKQRKILQSVGRYFEELVRKANDRYSFLGMVSAFECGKMGRALYAAANDLAAYAEHRGGTTVEPGTFRNNCRAAGMTEQRMADLEDQSWGADRAEEIWNNFSEEDKDVLAGYPPATQVPCGSHPGSAPSNGIMDELLDRMAETFRRGYTSNVHACSHNFDLGVDLCR